MTCQECLARTTEYLDGEMPAEERDRVAVHLARCESCARYHRVLTRGLDMVRELPDIEPPFDFHDRLQHRIFHVQDDIGRRPRVSPTGAALSLAVAGLIAFAAWGPLADDETSFTQAGVPAVDGQRPVPIAPAEEQAAIGGADPWFLGAPPVFRNPHAPPSAALAFPGPYSPLVVQPPARTGARSSVRFTSLGLE